MLQKIVKDAKNASKILALANTNQKNDILLCIGEQIWDQRSRILSENQRDIASCDFQNLDEAFIDRMFLDEKRLLGIVSEIKNVANLPDPVGKIFNQKTMPNGLQIYKQRVPLGLLAVIYESRPNVTIDIACLAIKTGNGLILRGGSETIKTNLIFVTIIKNCLEKHGIPSDAVQFIDNPDRSLVNELLRMYEHIDMLIPRGGKALHRFCIENSQIPVITGGIGICHLYVDEDVDFDAALKVIQNAKVQKPSVCNALDTLLVNRNIAQTFIPQVIDYLANDQVNIKLHKNVKKYIEYKDSHFVCVANADDFNVEWLSLTLGIKVVDNIEEAILHIREHGTAHSDGILTNNELKAQKFLDNVDSAAVYVNASTRFTDGAQFGLGAEVAVSTQKLHARGPMGLEELTTYKWIVRGSYHTRT